MTTQTKKVFDDLFGHPYNEAALYNTDNVTYQQYRLLKDGKRISNNWMRDAKLCGANIFGPRSY